MNEHGLGRRPSPPAEKAVYEARYGIAAAEQAPVSPVPVVLGCDWYRSFDQPTQKGGAFWLPAPSGGVRGGHAICLKPPTLDDPEGAYEHFNQGQEGACSGFAWSRASALMERRLFDGFALYHRAQEVDEWPGEDYDGTSINAGGRVCKDEGLWLVRGGKAAKNPGERWKIGAFWWAKDVATICACLGVSPDQGYIEFLNSWGQGYAHVTRMTLPVLDALLRAGADAAVAVNEARRPGMAAL